MGLYESLCGCMAYCGCSYCCHETASNCASHDRWSLSDFPVWKPVRHRFPHDRPRYYLPSKTTASWISSRGAIGGLLHIPTPTIWRPTPGVCIITNSITILAPSWSCTRISTLHESWVPYSINRVRVSSSWIVTRCVTANCSTSCVSWRNWSD